MAALFSRKPSLDDLPDELKTLLDRAAEERERLEAALDQVRGDDGPVAEVRAVAEQLEQARTRAESLEGIPARVDQLLRRIEQLEQKEAGVRTEVDEVGRSVGDLRAVAADLGSSLEDAHRLRREISGLTGPQGTVADLRHQADELRERFLTYQHDVLSVREAQAALKKAQEEALAGYDVLRERAVALKDDLEEMGSRVARIADELRELKEEEKAG